MEKVRYEDIKTIHNLLNWISYSDKKEWKDADGLEKMVHLKLKSISYLEKEKNETT